MIHSRRFLRAFPWCAMVADLCVSGQRGGSETSRGGGDERQLDDGFGFYHRRHGGRGCLDARGLFRRISHPARRGYSQPHMCQVDSLHASAAHRGFGSARGRHGPCDRAGSNRVGLERTTPAWMLKSYPSRSRYAAGISRGPRYQPVSRPDHEALSEEIRPCSTLTIVPHRHP